MADIAGTDVIAFLVQDPAYHHFADDRILLGIANAANTLTNTAFLAVGIFGLCLLWRESRAGSSTHFVAAEEMRAYWVLFAAVTLTAFGSAYYHLAPDDGRLLWDRLPMSLGFTALVAATVAERVRLSVGIRLLVPLAALGACSVLYWHWTGNLLPYAVAQFGSIGAILAIVILCRSRYTHGQYVVGVVAAYAAAKLAETMDSSIYAIGHLVSGHSLKHLLAAGAVWLVLDMLRKRRVMG